MQTLVDVGSLPPSRQKTAWSELVCERFIALDLSQLTLTGKDKIGGSSQGNLRLSRVTSGPQEVMRRADRVGDEAEPFLFVNLQTQGDCTVRQGAQGGQLSCGDAAVFVSHRPYKLAFPTAFEQMVLQLPLDSAIPYAGQIDNAVGHRINAQGSLASTMSALEMVLDENAAGAVEMTRSLLAIVFSRLPAITSAGIDITRERALKLIHEQSDDCELTPTTLAKRLSCSTRHLHLAFGGTGISAGEAIWCARLDRAAERLLAAKTLSLAQIAWDSGFASSAHLSRRFCARFGQPPTTWRKQFQQG